MQGAGRALRAPPSDVDGSGDSSERVWSRPMVGGGLRRPGASCFAALADTDTDTDSLSGDEFALDVDHFAGGVIDVMEGLRPGRTQSASLAARSLSSAARDRRDERALDAVYRRRRAENEAVARAVVALPAAGAETLLLDGRKVRYEIINTDHLMTNGVAGTTKARGLECWLELLHFPDVVVLTETSGARGSGTDLQSWCRRLAPKITELYQMSWTDRTTTLTGEPANGGRVLGGGVAVMWLASLDVTMRQVLPAVDDETARHNLGHLACYRFEPKRREVGWERTSCGKGSPLGCPLVVVAAYIPPAGSDWSNRVEESVMKSLEVLMPQTLEWRRTQGAHVLALGHWNASTGQRPMELEFAQPDAVMQKLSPLLPTMPPRNGEQRAVLSLAGDKCLMTPSRCSERSMPVEPDVRGARLLETMRVSGLAPAQGVFLRAPTSHSRCNKCALKSGAAINGDSVRDVGAGGADAAGGGGEPACALPCGEKKAVKNKSSRMCKCGKMRSKRCHDMAFVQSESIVDALVGGEAAHRVFGMKVQRVQWPRLGSADPENGPSVDHASTGGHVFLPDMADFVKRKPDAKPVMQLKRLHLVSNMKERVGQRKLVGQLLEKAPSVVRTLPKLLSGGGESLLHRVTTMERALAEDTREAMKGALQITAERKLLAANAAVAAEPQPKCAHCALVPSGRMLLKQCSGCHVTLYCSRSCQRKHWDTHKSDCKRLAVEFKDRSPSAQLEEMRVRRNNLTVYLKNVWSSDVQRQYRQLSRRMAGMHKQLRRLRDACKAAQRLIESATDKKMLWKAIKNSVTSPGSAPQTGCKLLDHITDKDSGRVVAVDPEDIQKVLVDWWQQSFRISDKLPHSCVLNVEASIEALRQFGEDLRSAHAEIDERCAAVKLVADPSASIPNGSLRDRLAELSDEARAQAATQAAASAQKGAALKKTHEVEYQKLQADISEDELYAVLSNLESKGPGVDGAPPEVLRCAEKSARAVLLQLLNMILRHGVTPATWEITRLVMHYKGKGADPHSMSNYRPLGIGATIEKVMSLIMNKRIQRWVETTKSLHASQCGFRPLYGTTEAIFSLSEAVRHAAADAGDMRPVYIVFVDIESAYTSVNHTQLWDALIGYGIDGRILSTLIGMYTNASLVLDAGGPLVGLQSVPEHERDGLQGLLAGSVRIERGVLQGHATSPILFNLYINSVIADLDVMGEERVREGKSPLGVPVPSRADAKPSWSPVHTAPAMTHHTERCCFCPQCGLSVYARNLGQHVGSRSCKLYLARCRREAQSAVPEASIPPPAMTASLLPPLPPRAQREHNTSNWYADDGAVMAREHDLMQAAIDRLTAKLESLGLFLNVGKTKVMVVPPLSWSEAQYTELKQRTDEVGFWVTVRDSDGVGSTRKKIAIVDEFDYLGVRLWWRWDYTKAWQHARARAWKAYYILSDGGLGSANMSMASMLQTARSLVLCHLDIVAQLTGSICPLQMKANAELEAAVLRLIAGNGLYCDEALRMEAGLWDPETRAQMLLLRFACKLAASELDSLPRRVMGMVHHTLECSTEARRRPQWAYANQPQYQTWSQSLLVAVRAFEVRTDCGFMVSRDSFEQTMFEARPSENLVSVGWYQFDAVSEQLVWQSVPRGQDALRDQCGVRDVWIRSVHVGATAKNYATGGMEHVWEAPPGGTIDEAWMRWSPALRSAEHLSLRERGNALRQQKVSAQLNEWSNAAREMRDYVQWKSASYLEPYWFSDNVQAARSLLRARVDQWGNEGSYRRRPHGDLERLEAWQRSCYGCDRENWMPETVEHVFVYCANSRIRAERDRTRAELAHLIEFAPPCGPRGPPKPDVSNDVAYFTLLQCCTGVGRLGHRLPASSPDASLDERRCFPEMDIAPGGAGAAVVAEVARWVRWWTERWTRDLANERCEAATGRDLVRIVCAHAQRMHRARQRAVYSKGTGFDDRSRDPAHVRARRPDKRKERKAAVARAAAVAAARKQAEQALRAKSRKAAALERVALRKAAAAAVVKPARRGLRKVAAVAAPGARPKAVPKSHMRASASAMERSQAVPKSRSSAERAMIVKSKRQVQSTRSLSVARSVE